MSRKLSAMILGIELPDDAQDGIAEFADAQLIDAFCTLYLEHPDLHPIARAECVDAVLSSLSLCIEQGTATDAMYERARAVVCDAQHNPWAARHLLPIEYDSRVDPGDHAVSMWLRELDGLDLELIRSEAARLNDPSNYLLD